MHGPPTPQMSETSRQLYLANQKPTISPLEFASHANIDQSLLISDKNSDWDKADLEKWFRSNHSAHSVIHPVAKERYNLIGALIAFLQNYQII